LWVRGRKHELAMVHEHPCNEWWALHICIV